MYASYAKTPGMQLQVLNELMYQLLFRLCDNEYDSALMYHYLNEMYHFEKHVQMQKNFYHHLQER